MIQKLLLIIRLLFLKFSDFFSGKLFIPGVKLLCLGMFFVMSIGHAATYYSRQSGNWNNVTTWSTSSGGGAASAVPGNSDDVILESGHSITVTANAAARTILFNSTNNILTVNSGFTLAVSNVGGITLDSSNSNSRVATITGGGILNCQNLNVGTNANVTADITTVLNSSISNLNVTSNLSIISRRNTANNNATFNLESGILNLDGQIITTNQNAVNTSTFSMATGAQSGVLLLAGATPFPPSGTGISTINLNGNASTVNYDGTVNQAVYATPYNNLISSGSGNKTVLGNITVNKDFTLTGGTFVLNNATSYVFRVLGNYNQTAGVLDFNGGTSGVSNMYVAGNFSNTAGASSISTIGVVQNGILNFNGTGIQTLNMPTAGAAIWVKYMVNTGSSLRLLSNLTLNRATVATEPAWVGDLDVSGTIDFNTFQVSQSGGTTGVARVLVNSGATVITAHANGLSGTNGSVLNTNLTPTFSTTANYIFNGTVAQTTSTAMPATINSLSINNTAGVTLSQLTNITNDFSLSNGSTANLGTGVTHTAKTITLNGNGQNSGTWGGTASAATNKSALYFGSAVNGIVNVTNSSCTAGYWTGITSNDWNTASNWCGAVPGAGTDVIIPSGTPFQPIIGAAINAQVRNLTVNTGATLTLSTATSTLNINGNFTNSGTLTTVAGSNIAFAGSATQTVVGFTTLGNVSMTKTAGVVTFTGAVNANALTINGIGGTLNLGASLTHNLTGDVTLTNGTLHGGSSTLNVNSSTATAWGGTGTNFTAGTSTVNFGGVAQTITAATTFNNLILSGTGAKTLSGAINSTNLTVTGITATNNSTLSVSTSLSGTGTLINSAGNTLNLGGTSTINTLTTTAAGNTVNYTGTAQTIVGNAYSNLTLSNSGNKTLSAATTISGNLNIATGVTLATSNFGLTLGGNFTNSGTITAGSSPITITGTTNQNIAGFNTTGVISVSKTTGVASFTSAFSTTGNLSISSGAVVDLGSVTTNTAGSLTLNGNGQNGGTWGGSAATTATNKSATYFGSTATGIVTISASSCTAGYWTGTTSNDWSVASNWCGGTVPTSTTNVVIPSGTPFMPTILAGTTAAAANLTINTSGSLTLSNAATSVLNLSGNFVNSGTFTAGAASILNLVGTTQSIAGGTYGNITISSGTKTLSANTVITNNLILNSGAVLNLNGITTHTTGTLTLNGSGPLLNSWGASNSGATNTDDTYFTGSGRITVTSAAPYSAIGNNYASYSKGVYGKAADSYIEGGNPIFSAPVGTVFINVDFASYGLPSGLPAPFTLGTCDAFNSRTVATTFLGNTTAQIPATNTIFGDPCYGTQKRLSIQATYTEPICSGTSPGLITGSIPNGGTGTYTYLWSVSTTSATAGYSPASGTNNAKDYTPGTLTQTTWYKRTVTSGMYSSETIVIVPVNATPIVPTTITPPVTICAGNSTTLAVSGGNKGGNGGYTQWFTGACGSAGTLIGTGDSISVTPTAPTTYYARYTNGCGSSTCISTTVTTSVTITSSATASSVCQSTSTSSSTLTYSAITGTPNRYNIVWSASPANSFVNVPDTTLPAGSISISVPANTAPGNYTGTLTVKNAANCSSFGNTFTITVNPLPAAPIVGTTVGIGCSNLGSVVLSGLPSGNWTINQTGTGAPASYVNSTPNTTSYTVTGLALGTYYFTVNNGTCPSVQTVPVNINDQTSATWNGTSWTGGPPSATKNVIINSVSPNQPFTADITMCSLTINSPDDVIIPTGVTITVNNAITSNGKLVFQNNSSLMQSATAVNTGNITYKRIAPKIRQADFVYWSTPVNPQTLIGVSPLTASDKYYYNNAPGWIEIDRNSTMAIGKGYIIRGPENFSNTAKADYEASFVGVPNNGTYTTPSLTVARYHLLGNPYPSALSVDLLTAGNSVLNGTVYLWTHNTGVDISGSYGYNPADYASYNGTGSVATTGNASNINEKPTGFIGAGQAFFVSTKATGTVVFNNSMRAGGTNNSQFFKSTTKEPGIEKNRVWLNMTNAGGLFKQLLVGYVEGATNGYENRFDGITMDANSYLDFYSIMNSNKFVIQGRALPFTDTDLVPLGYRTTIAGDFTIAIDEVDGKMSDQKIFIEDKTTGVVHDLTQSNYTFKTEAGTFTDRLILRYTGKTLGTGDFENIEDGILVSVKNKVINILSSKETIKEVTVYDVSGKLLYNKKKVGSTELQIQNLPSSNQVLLVKITLANDFTTTRKIIFQ